MMNIILLFFFLASSTQVAISITPDHIFLLAGQSNMVGYGGIGINGRWDGIIPPDCQSSPYIFRLDRALCWSQAKEPLHADIYLREKLAGVGPSMPFARRILELRPGYRTIGLVPCAYGGTTMDQWLKNYSHGEPSTINLYNNLIRRAMASQRTGGRLAGLIWWQGGADAKDSTIAQQYGKKLERFFSDVRQDLRRPNLPIILIVIPKGRPLKDEKLINKIRRAQLQMNNTITNMVVFDPPKKLTYQPDHVHVSTPSQVLVGRELAELFCNAGSYYC
ncbi:hypothetical protein SAY87_000619 [Trapa incisa]|uniref:Sialate O-acetylesterase domain-containing protein n=1 Tax=Trapa incisa TaxID=236973 RepID=A0AAN7GEU4_9MYRT|nr:hypothetical protein SAY87_000619 [Trapa incisa]